MNLKLLVEDRAPKVGIFWFVDGDIIEFTTDVRKAKSVQGYKDSDYDHHSEWPKVKKAFGIRGQDWAEIPRGRVIYAGPRERFEIITSSELAADESKVLEVMRRFSLPRSKTAIVTDLHYEINPDLEAEFD